MTEKKWFERLTGSLEDKRQYRQLQAREKALPTEHRKTSAALWRYLTYRGGITRSDELIQMYGDLIELMERAGADHMPVQEVIGEDPVEFAEDFLANYTDSQWINKEKDRLRKVVGEALSAPGEGEAS